MPNGLRLNGDCGEADGVRCSRGLGGAQLGGRHPMTIATLGSHWVPKSVDIEISADDEMSRIMGEHLIEQLFG